MPPTPEWRDAHARLGRELRRATRDPWWRRTRPPIASVSDLPRTDADYPEAVPVLLDWLERTAEHTGIDDVREVQIFRTGLCHALTMRCAVGTRAVPLMISALYTDTSLHPSILASYTQAAQQIAEPSDYTRFREIALDRSIGYGRAPILEWLFEIDVDDALVVNIGELDDPTVRAYILRSFRHGKNSRRPARLHAVVAPYVTDPEPEVRTQAKALLKRF
ncbi:hypothetical protein [Tsukamurella pseudospumae]|nr:hypothetical protein [Tsukamurella pseudospumae]